MYKFTLYFTLQNYAINLPTIYVIINVENSVEFYVVTHVEKIPRNQA